MYAPLRKSRVKLKHTHELCQSQNLRSLLLPVVALLLVCPLCLFAQQLEEHGAPAASSDSLSSSVLGNLTYACGLEKQVTLPLRNGLFQGELPMTEGRNAPCCATLVQAAWGQIPGAGDNDHAAAVIYVHNCGDEAWFYMLSLVGSTGQSPHELACAPLGDRIQVQHVEIDKGAVTVKLVTHAPEDPACCPTRAVTQVYDYVPAPASPGQGALQLRTP